MSMKTTPKQAAKAPDRNADPITDAPGAHPVGVGIGAAAGGAATGAVAGAIAGPVGAVVGAVAGAVAGGYAGKAAGEAVDPTTEEAYWRENHSTRPYYESGEGYDQYALAYKYGWESRNKHPDQSFDEAEPELARDWSTSNSTSKLSWDKAKQASRDAWDRVERATPGDADGNGK